MKKISVKDFFNTKKKDFSLSLITHPQTMEKDIASEFLHRPGLAFSGYFERFAYKRIQILGETEISFLQSLKDEDLQQHQRSFYIRYSMYHHHKRTFHSFTDGIPGK